MADKPVVPYLMLLNIKQPRPEHARILGVLKEISPDPKPVYFDKNGGAFCFNSDRHMREIGDKLYDVISSDDQFLIIEVGPMWGTFGLTNAAGWLTHHLGNAQFNKSRKK